jgi:hypothetical protein
LPWYGWAAIGLGILGVCAAGWVLFQKKIVPKGNGLHEVDKV